MSRRQDVEENVEPQEEGFGPRKSSRLASKPRKVYSNTVYGGRPSSSYNSRRGSSSGNSQGASSSRGVVEQEEHSVDDKQKKMAIPLVPVALMDADEYADGMQSDHENRKEVAVEKKVEEADDCDNHVPDLQKGMCAYMRLIDKVVDLPNTERAQLTEEGLKLMECSDKIKASSVLLDGVSVSKPESVLFSTMIRCQQLLKVANSPMFRNTILRYEPITEKEIAYLIYLLARIKCPQIAPDMFAQTEALLNKYAPNKEWKPIWEVLSTIRIQNMYMAESTASGPCFELSDFFSDNMLPSEGTTHINIFYFLIELKEKVDSGALRFGA